MVMVDWEKPGVVVTWRTLKGVMGEREAPDRATAFSWMKRIGDRCAWVDVHHDGELVGSHCGPPSWDREKDV